MKQLVVDIETDALPATKVWLIGTMDLQTKEVRNFQQPFNIEEIQQWLNQYEEIIGHNFIDFDAMVLKELVLSKLYNPQLENGHSLKAWGERLKFPKGDHSDWSKFSPEMLEYCIQDLKVTGKVYEELKNKLDKFGGTSIVLEHQVQNVVSTQINNGWTLDQQKCWELLAELKEKKSIWRRRCILSSNRLPRLLRRLLPSIK